jgi:methionine sulfoxide reductase heme-binding subunit
VPVKSQGAVIAVGITLLASVIGLLAFPAPEMSLFHQVLMGFGLYGFIFLVLAGLILPFLKEFVRAFGKPFLKIHHFFALTGLVFITLHPLMYSYEQMSLLVFVPDTSNWLLFWAFAGRVAFPLLYIALAAALLRKKVPVYWRPFHLLIYLALTVAIVHANLLGRSFYFSPTITMIFDALYAASIFGFVIKRYQNYKLRKKQQSIRNVLTLKKKL